MIGTKGRWGEKGETQLGIIIGGLFIGVLCWALFSLESCIREHKDGKVIKRHEQHLKRLEVKTPKMRSPEGYQVSY